MYEPKLYIFKMTIQRFISTQWIILLLFLLFSQIKIGGALCQQFKKEIFLVVRPLSPPPLLVAWPLKNRTFLAASLSMI